MPIHLNLVQDQQFLRSEIKLQMINLTIRKISSHKFFSSSNIKNLHNNPKIPQWYHQNFHRQDNSNSYQHPMT